jgi:flagellin
MTVINTNNAAAITANALTKNERAMSQAMERLSTGQRINSASDDAAGLAIASRMTSQINGLNMAVRNTNDAISMVQTADGAMVEITSMLHRMRELGIQSASETNSATDRTALNTEYVALAAEIDRIVENTQWNGQDLLDDTPGTTGAVTFHVGANASQTIDVDFGDFKNDAAGDTFFAFALSTNDVSLGAAIGGVRSQIDADAGGAYGSNAFTTADVNSAIGAIDTALTAVNSQRATFGAAINRLEYVADNLANVSQNTSASRSRVLDADYASETTELARTQIIQQAATAMLSQANQQAQSVLALLR